MDLSSRTISRVEPGIPSRAKPGALRLVEARAALPLPPIPPSAATNSSPMRTRSASTLPSRSLTTVPWGTGRIRSWPLKPWDMSPRPMSPLGALWWGLWWYSSRVVVWASTRRMTSPPLPPLPPLGPPRGLNFSRRTETQPCPPCPPVTCRTTRSTNSATSASSFKKVWFGYLVYRVTPVPVCGRTPLGRLCGGEVRKRAITSCPVIAPLLR